MIKIDGEALTFDDVLLVPGYSEITAKDVSLKTRLSRSISLNIPLVSAAMDTVTESRLAIALAQDGGIGIIHKSMSIDNQAFEVRAVKKYESGVVKDPISINSSASISVNMFKAPLLLEYADNPGNLLVPPIPPILLILITWLFLLKYRINCLINSATPNTFTLYIVWKSSNEVSLKGLLIISE